MLRTENRLSHLPDMQNRELRLDRSLLRDQAADTLRDYISRGVIPEGTKLTERQVSRLLGISRMPARDALITMEAEGLVVTKPDGRYVIELTEKDVRDIHVLRQTLERLAAEQAAANTSEENQAVLRARLLDLEEATASQDPLACTRCDMALHRAIWHQADNPHLLRLLDSVLGAIFVLCQRGKLRGQLDFDRVLEQHRDLVELIAAGDSIGAGQLIESRLRGTLETSLRTYNLPQDPDKKE